VAQGNEFKGYGNVSGIELSTLESKQALAVEIRSR
jgi:hypothetical protein